MARLVLAIRTQFNRTRSFSAFHAEFAAAASQIERECNIRAGQARP